MHWLVECLLLIRLRAYRLTSHIEYWREQEAKRIWKRDANHYFAFRFWVLYRSPSLLLASFFSLLVTKFDWNNLFVIRMHTIFFFCSFVCGQKFFIYISAMIKNYYFIIRFDILFSLNRRCFFFNVPTIFNVFYLRQWRHFDIMVGWCATDCTSRCECIFFA